MLITECSLVDQLHKLPTRAVLFVTGGGLEIFKMLTHRGGGSGTLLSGLIPYTQEETYDLLGFTPSKLVSEQTTRQMAMVAYRRANKLAKNQFPAVGVSANMVLQKTPDERVGREHTVHVAIQTDSKTVSLTLHLNDSAKLSRTNTAELVRVWEEAIAARLILNAVAEALGSENRVSLGYGLDEQIMRTESTLRSSYFKPLLLGELSRLGWNINNGVPSAISADEEAFVKAPGVPAGVYIIPGSFNPQHDGHRELARLTSEQDPWKTTLVDFEISIQNVDKPSLDLIEIETRLRSFKGNCRVWLTNAPTFAQKAVVFPGAIFVVGYDTAVRICDAKYAGPVNTVCDIFRQSHNRFLVFGREQNGVYKHGIEEFPECFRTLATAMDTPPDIARISSTALRNQPVAG